MWNIKQAFAQTFLVKKLFYGDSHFESIYQQALYFDDIVAKNVTKITMHEVDFTCILASDGIYLERVDKSFILAFLFIYHFSIFGICFQNFPLKNIIFAI